jgi:hypothetical protein
MRTGRKLGVIRVGGVAADLQRDPAAGRVAAELGTRWGPHAMRDAEHAALFDTSVRVADRA